MAAVASGRVEYSIRAYPYISNDGVSASRLLSHLSEALLHGGNNVGINEWTHLHIASPSVQVQIEVLDLSIL